MEKKAALVGAQYVKRLQDENDKLRLENKTLKRQLAEARADIARIFRELNGAG